MAKKMKSPNSHFSRSPKSKGSIKRYATGKSRKTKEIRDKQNRQLFEIWKQLSNLVHRGRHTPHPSSTNALLRQHLELNREGLLAPALLLWMGDNFLIEARFREAIAVYTELVESYPNRSFGGKPWAAYALEQISLCYRQLGEPDAAISAYQKILNSFVQETSKAWIYYQIGCINEEANHDTKAIRAYRRAAKEDNDFAPTQASIPDLARRDANRLASRREWIQPRPENLAKLLSQALESQDAATLRRLASPTHFTFGFVGCERHFVQPENLLRLLTEELSDVVVSSNPSALRGSGSKLYLETQGWKGPFFSDRVVFILTQSRDGFEWSGLALTRIPRDRDDPDIPVEDPDLPPVEPGTKPITPADLKMKAPWPVGLNFRAGGLIGFTGSWPPSRL
jgi:tetratricopeptide (TPR) repeat protein